MRKLIMSAVVATLAATSFAAPSQAGGYGYHGHHRYGGGVSIGFYDTGYYGGDYYEPYCYIKKVKRWDKWGNLRIRKIKICE